MNRAAGTVFIVDDDREIRMALRRLLEVAGYQVRAFESAERFLAEQDAEMSRCLLLELCLPGMSGLELQRSLVGSPSARPVVFLTGMADIEASVRAMQMGAVDFLTKPIDAPQVLAAVEQALRRDAEQRQERALRRLIEQRVDMLSRRERQVMELVIRGQINRLIGVELEIEEKTVKVHHMRVMRKMGARSVAELVCLTAQIGVNRTDLAQPIDRLHLQQGALEHAHAPAIPPA